MIKAGPEVLRSRVLGEVDALNERQRNAVLWDGNATCMAGPGSGKTRTLVTQIAYTLVERANQRDSVAAITYTRAAAKEIISRLQALGFSDTRRVRVGTLHSFCYQDILKRHSVLLGLHLAEQSPVLTAEEQDEWERDLEQRHGLWNGYTPDNGANTTARRALAVGDDYDRLDPERLAVVRDYEARLVATGRLDQEQMIIGAFKALRDHPALPHIVASRYPYLLVDEYQDLGAVLHGIVLLLLSAGVRVFAVGDPDQSVMGFTGADPRYLLQLAERPDFKRLDFEVNYRSGQAIIDAAQLILREERPYAADPERPDPGTVTHVGVSGGQEEHATVAASAVKRLHESGLTYSEIAVLYPARGPLADAVANALVADDIPVKQERALRTIRGPLGEFAQASAARLLAGPQPGANRQGSAPSMPQLVEMLRGLSKKQTTLSEERRLTRGLVSVLQTGPHPLDASALLSRMIDTLGLDALGAEERAIDDARADLATATLDELAGFATLDAVTFTTYASAKGREFRAVVLPGLIEGLVPRWQVGPGYVLLAPTRQELSRSRAAFYVAFTRAEDEVVMISGRHWFNKGGYATGKGHSRFVYEALGNASPYQEPG